MQLRSVRKRRLPLRAGAQGYGEHDTAGGEDAYVVLAVDAGLAVGGEGIGVGGAIRGDGLGCGAVDQCDAGDAVLVEEVVEAEAELGAVEAAAAAQGVVDEEIADVEGGDGELVVIRPVVLVFGADALVEEAGIPVAVLVGETFGFDVGGGLCDVEAAGGVQGELGCGGGAAGGSAGAAHGL